ncbi:hypothetical protein HYN46_07000 [Aquirhabdus parva]|uniref:Uncharacterized protein n=1 Tax=Aquirhabdus parva TaxID=2283318 RepID=A0A345P5N6_9GAMM|nr:hypothetical protein HYN46_07000 [Aquirhabdus parva]
MLFIPYIQHNFKIIALFWCYINSCFILVRMGDFVDDSWINGCILYHYDKFSLQIKDYCAG